MDGLTQNVTRACMRKNKNPSVLVRRRLVRRGDGRCFRPLAASETALFRHPLFGFFFSLFSLPTKRLGPRRVIVLEFWDGDSKGRNCLAGFCAYILLPSLHRCNRVSPVFHPRSTRVSPLCFTRVPPVFHPCVSPLCFTRVPPLFHPCFTLVSGT